MARRSILDTVVTTRSATLAAALPLALAGERAGVHQARVASRRLREVLPVLDAGPRVLRAATRAVRRVTRALGPVRELDVSQALADELLSAQPLHPVAAASLRRALAAARAEAMRAARTRLSERRVAKLATRLDAVEEVRASAARPAIASAAARVSRRAARARRLTEALGVLYEPEQLHAVRIALKRWRYALEVLTELRRAKSPATLVGLRRLQDLLGRAHDLHVLGEHVRAVEASVVTRSRPAARDLARFAETIDAACRREHAAFLSHRDALLAATAPARRVRTAA